MTASAAGGGPKTDMGSRQREIMTLLRRQGFVSIERLARSFKVSEQTVRRDIKKLEKRGLVTRYHGGAGLPHGPADVGYEERKSRFAEEKHRVAELVASRIPDGATIFIDIGTTMEAVAEALLSHRRRLTVLTNHVTVATILSRRAEFEIIVAGGILRHRDHATIGQAAREFIQRFRVGYGIFGIGGVTEDGELLDYDFRDIGVSTTAMKIARRRFVALDHSKFETDAMVHVGHVADIDALFTDVAPPRRLAQVLRRHNVDLVTPASAPRPPAGDERERLGDGGLAVRPIRGEDEPRL